jgi:hypothetical protein
MKDEAGVGEEEEAVVDCLVPSTALRLSTVTIPAGVSKVGLGDAASESGAVNAGLFAPDPAPPGFNADDGSPVVGAAPGASKSKEAYSSEVNAGESSETETMGTSSSFIMPHLVSNCKHRWLARQ